MSEPGHRERKKQRTREAIVDAAFRLFAERGYEATTINDIAAEADLAERTFFSYFPTKEAVVFFDKEANHAGLRQRLQERRDGESAIDAMRAWAEEIVADVNMRDERQVARRALIRNTPSLREHERASLAGFEDALGAAVARDLDLPPSSLRPRLIAAAGAASLAVLWDFDEQHSASDPMAVVAETVTFLRGGITALRDHSSLGS